MEKSEEKENKNDDELLEEAKERVSSCLDYYAEEYQRGRDDVRFGMLGEQWPDVILNKRINEQRPCLVENRVHSSILQVVNSIRQSRPSIQVNPVDGQADIETAKILKGAIKNIEIQSGADNVYDTAALNSVTAGYGWIRVSTEYADDDSFDQEAKLIRIPDFASVMIDPNSKELDGSDAEYGFVFTDIEHEAFERMYPDEPPVSADGYDRSNGWCSDETVRICEYFYKEYKKRTIALTDKGVMDKADAEAAGLEVYMEREVEDVAVKWCKLSGASVLEKNDWVGKYIPLVPVYGEEVNVDGRRRFYSLVYHAKDPQRRYNYWLTAGTEIIALQPRAPFMGVTGQFKSQLDKWARMNMESYPYIEYDVVRTPLGQEIATPPQRQQPPLGSPAMFQEMMAAADGIKATLGIYDASLGASGNEKSGKAIFARQAQSDNATFHFVDNLQTSIRQVGRILVDIIPKIYSEKKLLRIVGDDGTKAIVPVKQPVVKGKDGSYQPVGLGQQADAFFDLGVGKYDVVATVGPSYVTQRRETAEMLQQLMTAIPESANLIGDLFIKNLDIPEAQIIVDRLRKVNPMMRDEGNPDEQKLTEAMQTIQAMQQELAQMGQALQAKRERDAMETQSEIAKNQADIEKTNAEIRKTEAETARIATEIAALQAQGTGLTPEAIAEVVQTIARLEAGLKDTADAVDIILSHEEEQATLQPDPMQLNPTENQNA